MGEPEYDDGPSDQDRIAELRAFIARLSPGSAQWRQGQAQLASDLLDTLPGPDAIGRLRALAEPEAILDSLRVTGPEPGEYRRLCLLSAQAAAERCEITADPPDRDAVIDWLERAAAPLGPGDHLAPDDAWWEYADTLGAGCELAVQLASRWVSTPPEQKQPDADRIVALLTPLLDGPDAGLLLDPAWCHACLGIVLCDRYRRPGEATPARLADRAAAIRHLRAAHAGTGLDPELRVQVTLDLVMMACLDWSDRQTAATDEDRTAPAVGELSALLDLLRPLLADRGETGGDGAELGGEVADVMCEHATDQVTQRVAIDWYRAALDHPGLDPEARVRISCNLGTVLNERAERNEGAPAVGDPTPDTDRNDALVLLDGLLDTLEPGSARLACLAAVVDLLWRLLDGPDGASALDRVVVRAQELAELVGPDDEDRASVVLRAGIALGRRVHREALSYAYVFSNRMTVGDAPGSVASLERALPEASAALQTAIDLLRTGTGLYHYDDDLYATAAAALGMLLVLDFGVRLPEVRTGHLREGLRRLRMVLERLPTDSDLRGSDLTGGFLMAVMYTIWFSAPFDSNAAYPDQGAVDLPDVTGFASVDDDMQLLAGLLEEQADAHEPSYEFLCAMLVVLRAPDGELTTDELRTWQRRLRRAGDAMEPEGWGLTAVVLAMSGAFGRELAARGRASATEAAAASTALYDARALAPPGTPLWQMIEAMLRRVGRPDPRGLLHGLFGTTPAAAGRAAGVVPDGSNVPDGPDNPREQPIEAVEFDFDVAVLVGDGSPDPFAVPAGRAIELLSGHPDELSAPATVAYAMVRYHRWLRERDSGDLSAAVAMVREVAGSLIEGPTAVALTDRVAALLAGMLLDRHLLLGDHADVEAAVDTYETLLGRLPPRARHRALPLLLVDAASPGERALLERLFLPVAGEPGPFRAELLAAAGIAGPLLARLSGPYPDGAAVPTAVERLREAERTLRPGHHLLPAVRSELAQYEMADARARDDRPALRAAVEAVVAAAAACPEDSPHRTALLLRAAGALATEEAAHAVVAAVPTAAADAETPAAAARADAALPTEGPARRTDAAAPARAAVPGAGLDEGIALLRRAADEGGRAYHGARARCLYGLGLLLCARSRGPAARAGDLDDAVSALREARLALDPGQGDAFSIVLTRALALLYRAYGPRDGERRRQSRETARSVLAAHGRAVLLQTGAHRGLDAARAVSADMMRLVSWCIADEMPELAVEAVELGRGLVLNAATVNATVPDLLREEGHDDLAVAWERSVEGHRGDGPVGVPDDLRRRVVEALTGSRAERRLLSAPSPAHVGGALRQVGADALVHLVPGENGPGHALIVTATGTVRSLDLPGLRDLNAGPLGGYNRALREFQDAGRPEQRPQRTDPPVLHSLYRVELARKEAHWRRLLDELSTWAGTAAMDDLLAWAGTLWPGRLPRLVLAPVGPLGVVPWHAARCSDDATAQHAAGPRPLTTYAVQRAELSYCATARQLLEVAARRRTPLATGTTLLVVDPEGTATMHHEARLIRSRFRPDAVVVGDLGWRPARHGPWTGPAPLPATLAAVDPYLPGRGETSAALSHLNCHADTGPTAADSVLRLDRGNPLTVADLLAGARDRDPRAPGGIVVLANCTSDLALSDHDEALTLSTAVLGAGAATVVGSRWSILDDPRTTLLMCLFHHGLKTGSRPGDALRAAQLWMLDPARTVPSELADIVAAVPDTPERPWSELEVWASFTHHGR